MVKKLVVLALLASTYSFGQVIGKTTTEDYQADFEKRASLLSIPEYDGDPVPVALLNIGVTEDVLNQYPEHFCFLKRILLTLGNFKFCGF